MATKYDDFYVIRATPTQLKHLRSCVHRTLYLDKRGAEKLRAKYGDKMTNTTILAKINLGEEVLKTLEES